MKKFLFLLLIMVLVTLVACNQEDETNSEDSDELKMLEVDFEVPENANVRETIDVKAIVTYGDEKVTNADEVEFEYWEEGNEGDSTHVEANNNEDGTYTAEIEFDHKGVFEMYAHVTAESLHTMPKKSITVDEIQDGEE
ncbi:FixH family protein [Virgibacillus natechei]